VAVDGKQQAGSRDNKYQPVNSFVFSFLLHVEKVLAKIGWGMEIKK